MQELKIGNKIFFSSRRTGELLGYTNDYVGKLCREGKLESKMVGRNWYVSENSIKSFAEGISKEKELRKQELSKTMLKEYHRKQGGLKTSKATESDTVVFEEIIAPEEVCERSHILTFLLQPLSSHSSQIKTLTYLTFSLSIAGVALFQIPQINNFAKNSVLGAGQIAREIAQADLGLANLKKIPIEAKKGVDKVAQSFEELGQIGRAGFWKTGTYISENVQKTVFYPSRVASNIFKEKTTIKKVVTDALRENTTEVALISDAKIKGELPAFFYRENPNKLSVNISGESIEPTYLFNTASVEIGNFYISSIESAMKEFVSPVRIATNYYNPLFRDVLEGVTEIGNTTLNLPLATLETVKYFGDFYVTSTGGIVASLSDKFKGVENTLESSKPNLKNTAQAYLSSSYVSNQIFDAAEKVTGSVSDVGNFYIYATVGSLTSGLDVLESGKDLYDPLIPNIVGVYSVIGEHSIFLYDKTYVGLYSIGNGVLLRIENSSKKIASLSYEGLSTMNNDLGIFNGSRASIGGFWNSFIDNLSDLFVPLFSPEVSY